MRIACMSQAQVGDMQQGLQLLTGSGAIRFGAAGASYIHSAISDLESLSIVMDYASLANL